MLKVDYSLLTQDKISALSLWSNWRKGAEAFLKQSLASPGFPSIAPCSGFWKFVPPRALVTQPSSCFRQQTKNKCPQDHSCWQWQLGCHLTTKTLVIWGFGKGKHLSASLSAKRSYDQKNTAPVQPTDFWSEYQLTGEKFIACYKLKT